MNENSTCHIRDARPDDAPALADAVIIPIVTTFKGLVPEQCLTWLTREESTNNWQRWFRRREEKDLLLVAEVDSGLVVGCALGGPQSADSRFAGELYLLGVLPAYQGRGIGRGLVQATASRLLEQDISSMRVLVLSMNPHRRFYENLGGQYMGEQPYDWNGVALREAIYGWSDITALANSAVK